MLTTESLIGNFSWRYRVAIIVIASLISAAYIILTFQHQSQQQISTIINKAGQQRMLSQRIMLLIYKTQQHEDVAELRYELLNDAIDNMTDNHLFIKRQFMAFDDEAQFDLNELFYGHFELDKRVNQYIQLAAEVALKEESQQGAYEQLVQLDKERLLEDLDSVVTVFEKASDRAHQFEARLGFFTWLTLIVLLVIVSIAIFEPMRRWLSQTYDKLYTERNRVADFRFALNRHSVVMQVNKHAELMFYNKKFSKHYGFEKEELLGKPISILRSEMHSDVFYHEITAAIENHTMWHGNICNKAKNNRLYWFSTTIVPLKHTVDSVESSIIIQNDITEQKQTELALKRLHEITADASATLEHKVNEVLKLGCDIFHLPLGIVSRIDKVYTVLHVQCPNNELSQGDEFDFKNTYCHHTYTANSPVAFHHVAESALASHPCYESFALESYIGCPLIVDGKRFGTINFSSPEVSEKPFNASDLELIQLIAHWISYEFLRDKQRQKLLSQQQLMEQMSQQARVGAWEVNLLNNEIYWSKMTKKIHEVPDSFIPRLDGAINFYKEGASREKIATLVARSIEFGEPYQQELELVTANGNEIWIEAKGEAEFENDKCVRLFGSIQDITERVSSQHALAQSNERLEFVMSSTEVGIWDWELDSNNVIFNERWAEILGYSLEELEPITLDTWYSRVHHSDLVGLKEELARHWQNETKQFHFESRMQHKDGHWVWVLDTGKVVESFQNGKPKRMIGTHLDISAPKLAEIEIQDTNERMALAADSAGIGIWDYNVITSELNWDRWMFRLYGVDPDDFSGAYEVWEQGLHPDDKQRAIDELQLALTSGGKFDTQFRIVKPNGEVRYIKASAINKYGSDNRVTNMIGVNYDVTDRVENEIALTEAKTDAESAVIAKNEFLASMSHEIRTPMNGVIGMLDLLERTILDSEQAHHVSVAQNSANSLLSLINDILDFSKIDADKLELEHIPFNLNKLVAEVAELFTIQAQNKGLALIVDTLEVQQPRVLGDPGRIRQVLTNLIANAIKFTNDGEVVVKVATTPRSAHWHVTLSVKDTGIGIAPEKHSQVFEVFSQADSSTTRYFGGTGLGLAIVKKLCDRMSGQVSLNSELGHGSEFICQFEVGQAVQITANIPQVDLEKLTVLLVDENETNRSVLCDQIKRLGASVNSFANGLDALVFCQTQQDIEIDVAIVDFDIAQIKGDEFVKQFLALPKNSNAKVIMMASIQTQGDAKYFAKIGCNGYFPKSSMLQNLPAALSIIAEDGAALRNATPLVTQHYIKEIMAQPKQANAQKRQIYQGETTELPKLTILLVEDNKVNQLVAKGILGKLNQECDIAENGQLALERLRESDKEYDVIFMDVQMPVMDGLQTTQAIRNKQAGAQHQNVNIIAMTANAMDGDREKCIDAGMDDYIAKPINISTVLEKLLQLVQSKR